MAVITARLFYIGLMLAGILTVWLQYNTNENPIFWRQQTEHAIQNVTTIKEAPLPKRPAILRQSQQVLKESLSENPVQPYAWAALADTERALGDDTATQQLKHWRHSLNTGFYEPRLAHWRTRLPLSYYDYLTEQDKMLLQKQLKIAWDYQWYVMSLTIKKYGGVNLLKPLLSNVEWVRLESVLVK